MRQWHLIYDSPMIGARNMAIDEVLLTSVSYNEQLPTLRLYAWNPPCLSLGYGQRSQDIDKDRLNSLGWDITRRMTGGKAILHADELTYSIALPINHPIAEGGIIESYRRISGALLCGLDKLGLQSHADKRADDVDLKNVGPVCFEMPSHYEITTQDGRKLIGSAQIRRKHGLLQHGTIPISGDIARICDVLIYDNEIEREESRYFVRERATTLEEALDKVLDWRTVADAITSGFENIFGIEFVESPIINQYAIQSLVEDNYANPERIFRL